MKKILITLAMLCAFTAAAHAEDVAIKLIVDNKIVETETVSVNDRTLVPVRALMESTGAEVLWDEVTQGIDVKRGEKAIVLQIDNSNMTVNGEIVALDAAPILYNDTTTYVPLRAICEAFNFNVDWDEDTKTILINAPGGNPYVDMYGITTGEYNKQLGLTAEQFEDQTGLKLEEYSDKSVAFTNNSIPLSVMAAGNGLSCEELKAAMQISDIPDDTPWGEAIGEAPMSAVIEVLYNQQYSEELFETFKGFYNLGSEYTGNTKYKYVRTLVDTIEYNNYQESLSENQSNQLTEEQLAQFDAMLPELCENKKYFTIILTDGSVMKGELYPDLAKETVENFIKLCNEDFYDGLIFHRVIDGFMIQGGGYDKDFNAKEADAITGEFYANGYVNPLKHERGVISMARTNEMNSASSQFFIMDEASPHLDGYYAAFGKITEGLEVIDRITAGETTTNELGMSDVPVKPVVIKSITVE